MEYHQTESILRKGVSLGAPTLGRDFRRSRAGISSPLSFHIPGSGSGDHSLGGEGASAPLRTEAVRPSSRPGCPASALGQQPQHQGHPVRPRVPNTLPPQSPMAATALRRSTEVSVQHRGLRPQPTEPSSPGPGGVWNLRRSWVTHGVTGCRG